uniref:Predicted gene 5134 n=1 Tax=Jaculus jaculus TaxID=51337 RepID=A0A8C5KPE5_JACJA
MDHHYYSWNRSAVGLGVHGTGDAAVMALYLVLVLGIGLWVRRGTLRWTIFMLFILGWIFVPIYAKAGVVTLPEYVLKRFGSVRMQRLLSVMFLFVFFFSRISLDICFGAMFFKIVWDIDIYQMTLVVLIVAAVYTITGGLVAVAYVEAFQAGILVFGSAVLTGYAFGKVGGYQELKLKYFKAIPQLTSKENWTARAECYLPRGDAFHLFRDPVSGDVPWPGLVFGATFVSLFYGCADQVSVQRCLAGKSSLHAKGGCLLCGCLKLLPMFIMVMPGMASRALFPDQVACVVPSECEKYCNTRTGCSPLAYPMLVIALMPSGLQGFMLSVLCAAVMSSLTSVLNSSSAIFTMNIYPWMRPVATEKELMVAGRFFVIILLALTIVWVPIMDVAHSDQLFKYMQVMRSSLTTPISAVFLLAVFCKRVNEKGAFWGMIFGIVIGLIRLLAELLYGPWTCEGRSRCPAIICGLHYLYFSMLLLPVSALAILAISLATDALPDEHLHGLCWSLRNSREPRVCLGPEVEWKSLSKLRIQPDKVVEAPTCLWKSWDWFCGLDPRPGSKLIPENVTEMKTQANMRQMQNSGTLGNRKVLIWGQKARNMEVDKKTQGDMLESPFWRRVVNISSVLLFALVVAGHIYYA